MAATNTKPTLTVHLTHEDLQKLFGDNCDGHTLNAFESISEQISACALALEHDAVDIRDTAAALLNIARRAMVVGDILDCYHRQKEKDLSSDNLRTLLRGANDGFDPDAYGSAADLAVALVNLLPHAGYRPETAGHICNALAFGFQELDRRSAARSAEIDARANGGAS